MVFVKLLVALNLVNLLVELTVLVIVVMSDLVILMMVMMTLAILILVMMDLVIATAGSLKRPRMAFIASRIRIGQTSHDFARVSVF